MGFRITLSLFLFSLYIFCASNLCVGDNVKKSVDDNRDDNGDTNEESKDESLSVPVEPNEQQPAPIPENNTCTRRSDSHMHEIKTATHNQFPFVVSVMSKQNEHVCSGTVVSNGIILTSATCIEMPISHILLNATKAKKDDTTVALHLLKTEKFPTYTSVSSNENGMNVGIIYTQKLNSSLASKIRLSNFTSPRSVIDMEVLGFGLNAEVGQTKELQYVGAENRPITVIPTNLKDELYAYIDCIDTKVSTCFKDFGGPSIFDNELIGVVMTGDYNCLHEITATYSVNKKLADILPTYTFKAWLDEKIKKNEEKDLEHLPTFPSKVVASRRQISKDPKEKTRSAKRSCAYVLKFSPFVSYVLVLLITLH